MLEEENLLAVVRWRIKSDVDLGTASLRLDSAVRSIEGCSGGRRRVSGRTANGRANYAVTEWSLGEGGVTLLRVWGELSEVREQVVVQLTASPSWLSAAALVGFGVAASFAAAGGHWVIGALTLALILGWTWTFQHAAAQFHEHLSTNFGAGATRK